MIAAVLRLKLGMDSCANNQITVMEKTVVRMLTVYHLVKFSKFQIMLLGMYLGWNVYFFRGVRVHPTSVFQG